MNEESLLRELDLLVDGELPEHRRTDLLRRLDDSPEAWRRCALAFIEAQQWRSVLQGAPAVEPAEAVAPISHTSTRHVQPQPPARRLPMNWRTSNWLAAAAGLLIAFGLGAAGGSLWRGPGELNPNSIPMANVVDHSQAAAPQIASQAAPSISVGATPATDDAVQWMVVQTPTAQGGVRNLKVPVVASEWADQWRREMYEAPLDDLVSQLKRRGFVVNTKTGEMSLTTRDGRRVKTPYREIEVQPAAWLDISSRAKFQSPRPHAQACCTVHTFEEIRHAKTELARRRRLVGDDGLHLGRRRRAERPRDRSTARAQRSARPRHDS